MKLKDSKKGKRLIVTAAVYIMTVTTATAQNWRDSLAVLNKQIEQQPQSTDLRLRKAAVNIEMGQWEYAAEEYGRVLQLDRQSLAAHYYRAYCYVHLRQYALAKGDYEAFLQVAPMNMEARLGLAMVNEKLGRKTDALDEYNQLVQMFPDSAVCYAARAAYETTLGQYDVALYDWDEAIKRRPANADYVVTKVELLLAQKRNAEALEELKKALQWGIPRGVLKPWFDKCQTTATR